MIIKTNPIPDKIFNLNSPQKKYVKNTTNKGYVDSITADSVAPFSLMLSNINKLAAKYINVINKIIDNNFRSPSFITTVSKPPNKIKYKLDKIKQTRDSRNINSTGRKNFNTFCDTA